MGAGMVGTLALIYAAFTALAAAAGVTVVRKAGYSGWWVVAALVPLVNVVMIFTFAFADWPVLQQLRRASTIRTAEPAPHPNLGIVPSRPSADPYFGA